MAKRTENETNEDLEQRVQELEKTVKKMLPGRREVLAGGAVAGAGLLGFGAGSASADGLNDGDTQWGSDSNRDDYVVDHVDGISASLEKTINNRVQVSPDDDIQTKIDTAGTGGTVVFEPGTYSISSSLQPASEQTWWAGESVVFRPSTDNDVLDLTGTSDWAVDELRIEDPDGNQTSTAALYMDEAAGNYIGRLLLDNVYNGIRTAATNDGTKENVITSLYGRSIRHRGLWLGGQSHDNHFTSVWLQGASGSDHGILIDTDGIDGGNQFGKVLSINFDGDGFQIAGLNREIWIDQAILDKAGSFGFNHYATGNRGCYIGTMWTSGCGSAGFRVSGTGTADTDRVWDTQVSQLYAIGNAAEGATIEYAQGVQFGKIISRDNSDGLKLQTGDVSDFHLGHLQTGASNQAPANSNVGVGAPTAGTNVRIASYYCPEGTGDLTNVETLEGAWS